MSKNRRRRRMPVFAFLALLVAIAALEVVHVAMPFSGGAIVDGKALTKALTSVSAHDSPVETNPEKTRLEVDKDEINRRIEQMERMGAKGAVSIHVMDEEGNPICAANVRLGFTQPNPDLNWQAGIVEGKTDTRGLYGAERMSTWSCVWSVSKEGFHSSRGEVLFTHKGSRKAFLSGRWTDEPIVVDVRLKKISGARFVHGIRNWDIVSFPTNTWTGFDFIACDLVEPYGSGKLSHVLLRSESDGVSPFCKGATFGYTNVLHVKVADGGLSVETEAGESESPFVSLSPTSFGTNMLTFVHARTKMRILEDSLPRATNYIVFNTYVGHHGSSGPFCGIMRNVKFSPGKLRLEYFFNPVPGDTRLDADVSSPLDIGK